MTFFIFNIELSLNFFQAETQWSPWSECSVTCGTGSESRSRKCLGPECGEGQGRSCNKDPCAGS